MRNKIENIPTHRLEGDILWKWFSRYIRLRDADENGYVTCCTCNRPFFWNETDCGHYSKRNKRHKYNEQNNHPQCHYCNRFLGGEPDKLALYIDERYGRGTAINLRATENRLSPMGREEVLNKLEYYRSLAKGEAKKRGIKFT